MKPIICAAPSVNLGPVIPGRHRKVASPESITTDGNDAESFGVMDSGLAGKSPRPGMTLHMSRIQHVEPDGR